MKTEAVKATVTYLFMFALLGLLSDAFENLISGKKIFFFTSTSVLISLKKEPHVIFDSC